MPNIDIIVSHTSDIELPFAPEPVIKSVLKACKINAGTFEFNFVDNDTMITVHKAHLGNASVTDTITYNLGDEAMIHGDAYICVDQAQKNAELFDNTFENELKLLIVHCILHLLGFRDYTDEEKARMRKEEARVLSQIEGSIR